MILPILQHALGRDKYGKCGRDVSRNHYVTGEGSDDITACREAVAKGLMREHPASEISGGDPIFTVTDAGRSWMLANSPAPPKVSRGKARYLRWLSGAADFMTFGEWLKTEAAQ